MPVKTKFRPFVVKKIHPQRANFKVVRLTGKPTRKQIMIFLKNLPMRFRLVTLGVNEWKTEGELLEVHVLDNIVCIYPPKGTKLYCSSFQAWEFFHITSKMRVDNIMDDCESGNMRSCVHLHPGVLEVPDCYLWRNRGDDVEVDIFKYPNDREKKK